MSKNYNDIYAGISGITLPIDEFDFGNSIKLSKTYAHVFGPYLAAFKKPERKGMHHPGPWVTISGGIAFDIQHELYIPEETRIFKVIDNLNTVWVIAALLRLKVIPLVKVPVISNLKFSEIENSEVKPVFHPIETTTSNLFFGIIEKFEFEISALEWVKNNYKAAGQLFEANDKFSFALLSIDRSCTESRFSMAMMTLWGAIEQIFSPDDKQELSYRISLNIASYLEERGTERQLLFKKIRKLYNARSKAAHGNPTEDKNEFIETYELLKRIIFKITEDGKVPTQTEFEERILG